MRVLLDSIGAYLGCGALAWSLNLGEETRDNPYGTHLWGSVAVAVLGPVAC